MFSIHSNHSLFLFTLIVVGLFQGELSPKALSQTSSQATSIKLSRSITFVPQGNPRPKKSTGAGTRGFGQCPQDQSQADYQKMHLLVPPTEDVFTISSHPTLLARLPETSAKSVVFSVIRESDGEQIYETTIPVEQPGILALSMPSSAPPLELSEEYMWSVTMVCQEALVPGAPYVEATIQRVASANIEGLTLFDQAKVFGEKGIWYDMLASLYTIAIQDDSPSALQNFNQVISSVGLQEIPIENIR